MFQHRENKDMHVKNYIKYENCFDKKCNGEECNYKSLDGLDQNLRLFQFELEYNKNKRMFDRQLYENEKIKRPIINIDKNYYFDQHRQNNDLTKLNVRIENNRAFKNTTMLDNPKTSIVYRKKNHNMCLSKKQYPIRNDLLVNNYKNGSYKMHNGSSDTFNTSRIQRQVNLCSSTPDMKSLPFINYDYKNIKRKHNENLEAERNNDFIYHHKLQENEERYKKHKYKCYSSDSYLNNSMYIETNSYEHNIFKDNIIKNCILMFFGNNIPLEIQNNLLISVIYEFVPFTLLTAYIYAEKYLNNIRRSKINLLNFTRIFLVCTLIASKYWHDDYISNDEIAIKAHIPSEILTDYEMHVMNVLEYDLQLSKDEIILKIDVEKLFEGENINESHNIHRY
ncbi:hypothetical protein COBT_002411, partial [Conglomerata obtusa]